MELSSIKRVEYPYKDTLLVFTCEKWRSSLEHEANRETQHILPTIEYHVLFAYILLQVDGAKAFRNVVQAILEREIKEYTGDVDTESCHKAEIKRVYTLCNLVVW